MPVAERALVRPPGSVWRPEKQQKGPALLSTGFTVTAIIDIMLTVTVTTAITSITVVTGSRFKNAHLKNIRLVETAPPPRPDVTI